MKWSLYNHLSVKNDPGKSPISGSNNNGGYSNNNNNGGGYSRQQANDNANNADDNYVNQKGGGKRLPFGQEPFSHPSRQDAIDEERKNQEAADYMYNPVQQQQQQQAPKRREKPPAQSNQKDPDVWDPPSPPRDDKGI